MLKVRARTVEIGRLIAIRGVRNILSFTTIGRNYPGEIGKDNVVVSTYTIECVNEPIRWVQCVYFSLSLE